METVEFAIKILSIAAAAVGFVYNLLPEETKSKIKMKISAKIFAALKVLFAASCLVAGGFAGSFIRYQYYELPSRTVLNEEIGRMNGRIDNLIYEKQKVANFYIEQLAYAYNGTQTNNKIILFEHINYQGRRIYLPVENYSDFTAMGFNDIVSSIKIPQNTKIVLYKDINHSGEIYPTDKSIPTFMQVASGWNDAISSLKVIK